MIGLAMAFQSRSLRFVITADVYKGGPFGVLHSTLLLCLCRVPRASIVPVPCHGKSLPPSWEPRISTQKTLSGHTSDLHIPILSSKRPGLLFHGLGEEKDDPDSVRIAHIPKNLSATHMCVT